MGRSGQSSQPKLAYLDPAFQQWVKATQALPAEQQIEAVSKKLMELNPGFDGKVTPKIENHVVQRLMFLSDEITDISPVRALIGLRVLTCSASTTHGKLADLSPLSSMSLTGLYLTRSQGADEPLRWFDRPAPEAWPPPQRTPRSSPGYSSS